MLYKYIRAKKPEKMALIKPYPIDREKDRGCRYLGIEHSKNISRLIFVKKNNEWTLDDLTLASGLSRRSLIRWMKGQASPNRRNQRKLQRFLYWYK